MDGIIEDFVFDNEQGSNDIEEKRYGDNIHNYLRKRKRRVRIKYLNKSFLDNLDYYMSKERLEDAIIAFISDRYDRSIGDSLAFALLTLIGHSELCKEYDLLVRLIIYVQVNYGFSLTPEEMNQLIITKCINEYCNPTMVIFISGVDCMDANEYYQLYVIYNHILRNPNKAPYYKPIHMLRYTEFLLHSRFAGNFGHQRVPYCDVDFLSKAITYFKKRIRVSYDGRFDITKFGCYRKYESTQFCARILKENEKDILKAFRDKVERSSINIDEENRKAEKFLQDYLALDGSDMQEREFFRRRGLNNLWVMQQKIRQDKKRSLDSKELIMKNAVKKPTPHSNYSRYDEDDDFLYE